MLTRDPRSYLSDTEHAVRHLFDAIQYYESLLDDVIPPSQATSMDEVKRYTELAQKYFGYSFSEATLCGSILQVAFMGIYLFSKNTTIPANCTNFVKPNNQKAAKFCVGRLVHNTPIGLIIYAGRNQFNHWDDNSFDFPTRQVFKAFFITYYEDPFFDMAYELNYPKHTIKANHIVLNELRWRNYPEYLTDMEDLICP